MSKRPIDDTAGKPTLFEQPSIEKKERKLMEEIRQSNIYQKLAKLRYDIQRAPLKKTGHNGFQKFDYFELKDFIPTVMKMCDEIGLVGQVTIADGDATLTVINAETPDETLAFTVPWVMSTGSSNPIQNLGATITYIRRYLWMMALELVENDIVDAQDTTVAPKAPKATKEQLEQVEELYTPAQITSMVQKKGYGSLKDFTATDAMQAITFAMNKKKEAE